MSVNLRRTEIRVTQHGLDRPQVSPALQQVRRKCVAQHVRRYAIGRNPSKPSQSAQPFKKVLPRHHTPTARQEDSVIQIRPIPKK